MEKTLQVIKGGRVSPSAVINKAQIAEAYGRWSRVLKPIGLATLAWELGVSQNFLAREFVEIVAESKYTQGKRDGRASLWKVAA